MNSDQLKGKLEQAIGNVKQSIGEAFGDDKTANEGLGDQVKGSARETWGNVKDAAQTTAQDSAATHEKEASDKSESVRETISEKITEAKNAVNSRIDAFEEKHDGKAS